MLTATGGLTNISYHVWIYHTDGSVHCMYCGVAQGYSTGQLCSGMQTQGLQGYDYYNQYNPNSGTIQLLGMEQRETPKMLTKEQIAKNKFYVSLGARIGKGEGHSTLDEAIEAAKGQLSSNKELIEVVIHQVVKVVRKELPPVTVVDVE